MNWKLWVATVVGTSFTRVMAPTTAFGDVKKGKLVAMMGSNFM